MEKYRLENKQNCVVGGVECTLFDCYRYSNFEKGYVFLGKHSVQEFDAEDDACIESLEEIEGGLDTL